MYIHTPTHTLKKITHTPISPSTSPPSHMCVRVCVCVCLFTKSHTWTLLHWHCHCRTLSLRCVALFGPSSFPQSGPSPLCPFCSFGRWTVCVYVCVCVCFDGCEWMWEVKWWGRENGKGHFIFVGAYTHTHTHAHTHAQWLTPCASLVFCLMKYCAPFSSGRMFIKPLRLCVCIYICVCVCQ